MKYLLFLLFLFIVSCSGNSLVESDEALSVPPDGAGFVALHIENTSGSTFTSSEGFDVSLSHLSVIFDSVTPTATSEAAIVKAHGTDEHDAAEEDEEETEHDALTDCEEAEHLEEAHYVDLDETFEYECIALDIGTYTGIGVNWTNPEETEDIIGLDETVSNALLIEGTATLGVDSYTFVLAGNPDPVTIAGDFEIASTDTHLSINLDVADWFHGIDFSTLDISGDGLIYIDESNNAHTYEHLVEHLAEGMAVETM